jgi:hypothetical protein
VPPEKLGSQAWATGARLKSYLVIPICILLVSDEAKHLFMCLGAVYAFFSLSPSHFFVGQLTLWIWELKPCRLCALQIYSHPCLIFLILCDIFLMNRSY